VGCVPKVTPFLWFNGNALDAAKAYVKLFPRSKIVDVAPGPDGAPMGVTFSLDGQRVIALNGGADHALNPAFSLYVDCRTQAEVDRYWKALAKGGEEMPCGWLTDRFGVTWQIIPKQLPAWLSDDDAERAGRVMQAMLTMKKIDIAKLKAARAGKGS